MIFSLDDEDDDIDFAAELTDADELDNDDDGHGDNEDGVDYEEQNPKKKKGNTKKN